MRNALVKIGCLVAMAGLAAGQIKVGDKEIQVHGFFQQGFLVSSGNNVLTMDTRGGSFAMTDGGLNVSSRLTPKLRVGMQAFSRNVGQMGRGKVHLDWAFADYRFSDTFGVRAGKVKTTLGLFNDTQDMEFVHTFALLPQSVYPTDLRASTIAHTGGDIYGQFDLKKYGRLNYVAYGGSRPDDPRGGYYLGLRDSGVPIRYFKAWMKGADLRWLTPLTGLTVGMSQARIGGYAAGQVLSSGGFTIPGGGFPYRFDLRMDRVDVYYGDYQRGAFRTFAELRRETQKVDITTAEPLLLPSRAWYVAATYKLSPKWEVGGYYSDFRGDRRFAYRKDNGIRGPVSTVRYDVNKYWNVKAEVHVMQGYGSEFSFHTFYPSVNSTGFAERTALFVLRSGFVF